MSKKPKTKKPSRYEMVLGITTLVLSVATAFLGWKTLELNSRTSITDSDIKRIESQLKEERLGFDRIRDIYDRIEKYLASDQNERKGRALVALISTIPDMKTRTQLLSVISAKVSNVSVASVAAVTYAKTELSLNSVSNTEFIGTFKAILSKNSKYATLQEDFGFKDSKGVIWVAPAGTVTDGASIPASLISTMGSPFNKDLLKATVIHDYYVTTKQHTYKDTHTMFYEVLIASGISEIKAKLFYASLMSFGPRW